MFTLNDSVQPTDFEHMCLDGQKQMINVPVYHLALRARLQQQLPHSKPIYEALRPSLAATRPWDHILPSPGCGIVSTKFTDTGIRDSLWKTGGLGTVAMIGPRTMSSGTLTRATYKQGMG